MREVHLYIAEDGTEFEDEQECMAYEAGQNARMLKGQVVLLTEGFQPIPLDDLSKWDGAWYIFVKDQLALHALKEVWDWDLTGMYPPQFLFEDTAGLFAYDESNDEWYHMGTRLRDLQSIADEAMGVINKNM